MNQEVSRLNIENLDIKTGNYLLQKNIKELNDQIESLKKEEKVDAIPESKL